MNVEALEARARQLEQELDSLRVYAEEKEQEVIQAAELGKALLRDNENLEERLGEANRESMQRMEVRTDECELENTPSSHLLFFLPSLSPFPLSFPTSYLFLSLPTTKMLLPSPYCLAPSLPKELEQERFSLQQRLECQKATTLAVQQEMEAMKTDLQREYDMREQHLKQVSRMLSFLKVSWKREEEGERHKGGDME